MTTAEALAVVREALEELIRWIDTDFTDSAEVQQHGTDALAAIALIEERLGELERLFRENNRLGEALAYERSGFGRLASERRVRELEAALREIAERRAPGDREGTISRAIARRALGGGE